MGGAKVVIAAAVIGPTSSHVAPSVRETMANDRGQPSHDVVGARAAAQLDIQAGNLPARPCDLIEQQSRQVAYALGQRAVVAFDEGGEAADRGRASWRDDAALGQRGPSRRKACRRHDALKGVPAARRADRPRALPDQKIAGAVGYRRRLARSSLFTATNRMVGRDAASAMASASATSFGGKTIHRIVFFSASLWRFTNGFTWAGGISRTSWPRSPIARPR